MVSKDKSREKNPRVYTWSGLRNPRDGGPPSCDIISYDRAWKHFVEDSGHLRLRCEPFVTWLGEELANELAAAWTGTCSREKRYQLILRAGDRMAEAVSQCMNAPVVLRYRQLGSGGGKGERIWRLPLPNGCRMIVKETRSAGVLKTCHFPSRATEALLFPVIAWHDELTACVELYGELNPATRERQLPEHRYRVKRRSGRKTVTEVEIQFVKPSSWGFASERPGAKWTPPDKYPGMTA